MIVITTKQIHALRLRETDIESVMRRLNNNQSVYETCLLAFLEDTTVAELNAALTHKLWDDAFTAAHALKGVAGNMGFIPLMHHTAQLIILIRSGKTQDIPQSLERVNSSYRDIVDAIHRYFTLCEGEQKGDTT